jgi:ABC-type multidrug transport system fused ATPase/permease subunit
MLTSSLRYDRILVMDSGRVAEFDEPRTLFDRGGKFYALCERSGITRDHLDSARKKDGEY